MIADIGAKALPEATFVRLRDMMNGYALVKAKYPELQLPRYVFTTNKEKVQMSYAMVVEMIFSATIRHVRRRTRLQSPSILRK
jgi:hypothetical protein